MIYLYILIPYGLLSYCGKRLLTSKIEEQKTVMEKNKYRRLLAMLSCINYGLFIFVLIFCGFYALILEEYESPLDGVKAIVESDAGIVLFFFVFILPIIVGYTTWKRKILDFARYPSLCVEDFFRQKGKYLYLRAFERDYYDIGEMNIALDDSFESDQFSERVFFMGVEDIYAVCNPNYTTGKWLDKNTNVQRIFLENETWEDDVKRLVDASEMVYVLVSSRPSCIKEIEKAITQSNKVIFIVDNITDYENVLTQHEGLLPDISLDAPFAFNQYNYHLQLWKFQNNLVSYEKVQKRIKEYFRNRDSYQDIYEKTTIEDCCVQPKSALGLWYRLIHFLFALSLLFVSFYAVKSFIVDLPIHDVIKDFETLYLFAAIYVIFIVFAYLGHFILYLKYKRDTR